MPLKSAPGESLSFMMLYPSDNDVVKYPTVLIRNPYGYVVVVAGGGVVVVVLVVLVVVVVGGGGGGGVVVLWLSHF